MHFQSVIAASGAAEDVVTVSGQVVSVTTGTAADATAGIRVNIDGTMDERRGLSFLQIDSTTDWIIPNSSASSSYECRITGVTFNQGSGFFVEAAAENVWINLAGNREWSVKDTNALAGGIKDVSFTLEIRLGSSGGAVDTGAYQLISD